MVFSQRYKELINVKTPEGKNEMIDICGDIDFATKKKIAALFFEFAEPQSIHPNRYDEYSIQTSAFEQAVHRLNETLGYTYIDYEYLIRYEIDRFTRIAAIFTPYLFDLIEFQFLELSESEQVAFQKEENRTFEEGEIPWVLCDGKMIKIDPKQFEFDLRKKAMQELEELKDCEPIFEPAFQELSKAFDFFSRGEYNEAVLNATKSYESILKVLCKKTRGNLNELTTAYVERGLDDLPVSMDKGGFREKVLMSLAYIRNHTDSGHGAGENSVKISKPFAKLALNLSAALNAFLIEEYSSRIGKAENN